MKRIHSPVILLVVAILAYGLLIPQLGFYWDDLPMSWVRYQLGVEGMTQYFSTNRPVWALLYRLTTSVLPWVPQVWQVFVLFWHWVIAVTAGGVMRRLYPQHEKTAFAFSLLFLLYPGFNQQWAAYLYSHFFMVVFFFLFSYYLMLRQKTIPALIFSALNLWMMEYFFVLELMRPFVIWISPGQESLSWRERLKTTIRQWMPYLVVFTLAVLSRIFIFNNQVYGFSIRDELAHAPVETALMLLKNVLSGLWISAVAAWGLILQIPNLAVDGLRTAALYTVIVAAVAVLVYFYGRNQAAGPQRGVRERVWMLFVGVVMLGLAGVPFWLTNVPVSLGFPANRAMLSFMFGACFLFAAVLEFVPVRMRDVLLVVVVALAAGRQFLWANEFRRDWASFKNMYWQMTWRAPGLEKNTIVLMNEHLKYYADNSLGAALNWIYAPENHSNVADYVLFYPTNRDSLRLEKNVPVVYDFLAARFNGNTSQMVVFYYAPPKCLRLLDPEIDSVNRLIPDDTFLRDAALLSDSAPVLGEPIAHMPDIFNPEPPHNWCYFFQKADLARQMKDWRQVAELGDAAFNLDDHPNDPLEWFVYIEGYAHVGDWQTAVEYSIDSYRVSKSYVGPLLCRLWTRIERETQPSDGRDAALAEIRSVVACKP